MVAGGVSGSCRTSGGGSSGTSKILQVTCVHYIFLDWTSVMWIGTLASVSKVPLTHYKIAYVSKVPLAQKKNYSLQLMDNSRADPALPRPALYVLHLSRLLGSSHLRCTHVSEFGAVT